jgi:hypothetical protein
VHSGVALVTPTYLENVELESVEYIRAKEHGLHKYILAHHNAHSASHGGTDFTRAHSHVLFCDSGTVTPHCGKLCSTRPDKYRMI